jgi:hypothetical protein
VKSFTCDEVRERLSDALAGEIARPEANLLEAHLQSCEDCGAVAERYVWQERVFGELSAKARLDAMLARVRERIATMPQLAFGEEEGAPPLRRWGWAAAAAAILAATLGAFLWRSTPPSGSEWVLHIPEIPARDLPGELPEPELRPPSEPLVEATPVRIPDAPESERKETAVAPPKPRRIEDVPPPRELPAPPRPKASPKAPVKPVPAEVVEKPRTLDEAVRAGVVFLRAKAAVLAKDARTEEMVLWSMLHGGVAEAEPEFQKLLRQLLEKKLEKTYNVALQAMLLEELDRVKHQVRILQCAQFLVDNQCENGQWSYGDPSIFVDQIAAGPLGRELAPRRPGVREFGAEALRPARKLPVKKQREGPPTGDNSNSQIAALGLRACHEAGVLLPREVLESASKWWRDSQTRLESTRGLPPGTPVPEGWCYGKHDHKPYGSMTAGGVGSLVIYDYLLGRDWRRDREVANGMAWLGKNFSADFNPGPCESGGFVENSQHHYAYYLYALERAAILFGTAEIGRQDWFGRIAQVLLQKQRPDGAWSLKDGGGDLLDTCFAVLFLRKATRALPDVATPARR